MFKKLKNSDSFFIFVFFIIIFWFLIVIFDKETLFGWSNLISWETIVLIITAIAIFQQAKETKKSVKFLEYQTRPSAYPLLVWRKEKQKTFLYVKNDSKVKVLFNFRVRARDSNELIQDFREKPLNVFPGRRPMQYPSALGDLDKSEEKEKGTIFRIEYKIALGNSPTQYFTDYPKDDWRFENGGWIGPDGIEPPGVWSLISSDPLDINILNPDLKVNISKNETP
mgnify:CR=1 FL=1